MMLRFDLKKLLTDYEARTGVHVSYSQLAIRAGLSTDTIKSLAARSDYSPSLSLLAKICEVLRLDPRDYLHWDDTNVSTKTTSLKKRAMKKQAMRRMRT